MFPTWVSQTRVGPGSTVRVGRSGVNGPCKPYFRFYSTLDKVRQSKTFPPKQAFYNKLKQQHIDEDVYNNSKAVFDNKIAAGEWSSMSDYLKFYNLLDVVPLVQALSTCFDNYAKFFNVDACSRLSLPSIGFQAMYQLFDQKLPFVYTFNTTGDCVRQLFRDQVLGGLSTVFHRLVYTV